MSAAKSSLQTFRLRRVLEDLASKEGRGTELISLYVPPDRQIHEVMSNLKEEYGTASNIKSRTTRKNVQDAIERASQKLKLYKRPPPNGLVIFCGAIPQDGAGTEKMETYVFEPPRPIGIYYYRCDNRFHTEPLFDLLKEKESYGILVIDSTEAVIARLEGRRVEVVKELTSGIPGKHRAGGQSARRFERIREQAMNDYYKRVGQYANEIFNQTQNLKGIIVAGPGPTKYDFQEGEYLDYMLKKKVIGAVDTSYVGEQGVEEVVEKSQEAFAGVRYAEEKKIVQKFLYEVGHDTGLAVYGENAVRKALKDGILDKLLISERLGLLKAIIKCKSCGQAEERLVRKPDLLKFEQTVLGSQCAKCGNTSLYLEGSEDLLEEFIDMAEKSGVEIELISYETEEGVMLYESFGGIAGLLRYRAAQV